MTPAQRLWVEERADQWAEWVEKTADGGAGHRDQSCLADEVGAETRNQGIDFILFDVDRCVRFDAAVGGLADNLRVIFKMHWLGSERVTVATAVDIKAGLCGVSRRTYYRLLEQAYEQLWLTAAN